MLAPFRALLVGSQRDLQAKGSIRANFLSYFSLFQKKDICGGSVALGGDLTWKGIGKASGLCGTGWTIQLPTVWRGEVSEHLLR